MTDIAAIQAGIEEASDRALQNLSSEERASLLVRIRAAGNDEQLDRIKGAAPTKTYEALDLDFVQKTQQIKVEALYALWELETGVWRFFYERTRGQLAEADYNRYPEADWTEEPAPDNEFHEHAAIKEAVRFLGNYRAWKRYATDDLGVSLEEFLAHPVASPAADSHIQRIATTARLVSGEAITDTESSDIPGGFASGATVSVAGEDRTADELADWKYEQITAEYGRGER